MSDESTESPIPLPDEISAEKEAILRMRREARAEIPALFVDDWSMLSWEGHIRFVLGEWLASRPNYRAAFVMSLNDAQLFAENILERVAKRREIDAAEARKTPAAEGEA